MERHGRRPGPGTDHRTILHPVAQEPGSVITALNEPAHAPSAPAPLAPASAPVLPQMPACHIRPQKWTPHTSRASKYAPFVFIKRKYTSEDDEESGDEDAPNVPAAPAGGPQAEPKARINSAVPVPEVGGGRREQVVITYKRRSKEAGRAVARHQRRFKSLETILQGIAGDK